VELPPALAAITQTIPRPDPGDLSLWRSKISDPARKIFSGDERYREVDAIRVSQAVNFESAEKIIHRWMMTRHPGQKVPPLVKHAYQWTERKAQAKGPNCPKELLNLAILCRDEIMARGDAYKKRAKVREALADYLCDIVFRHKPDFEFLKVAEKLRVARRTGTWGTRPNGDVVTIWDDKSGLVRLDPDDAREESQRLAERYAPALLEKARAGIGIHYAVLTLPNFAPGKLAHGQKAIFRKYVNLLRKQANKQKLFPEIIGSMAILEAPLAADRECWNVHLNVLLITRSKFAPGLYKRLRQAWYWNLEIKPVEANAGDLAQTFNELIKYPTRAVSEKSASKGSKSKAPAMTDWPAERFIEWFEAQKRFRRTRTYGELYGKKVPKPESEGLDGVIWHGRLECSPNWFYAQNPLPAPLIDLIPGDNSTTQATDQESTGPP